MSPHLTSCDLPMWQHMTILPCLLGMARVNCWGCVNSDLITVLSGWMAKGSVANKRGVGLALTKCIICVVSVMSYWPIVEILQYHWPNICLWSISMHHFPCYLIAHISCTDCHPVLTEAWYHKILKEYYGYFCVLCSELNESLFGVTFRY
jgi:hypothetical protein